MMGIQDGARGVVLISRAASGRPEGGGASRSCYFVSIGKRMTPDFLPYNNMLINPLGPLWSGKLGSRYLRSLMAADLMRGRAQQSRSGGPGQPGRGGSDLEPAGAEWSSGLTQAPVPLQHWAPVAAHVLFIRGRQNPLKHTPERQKCKCLYQGNLRPESRV